MHQEDNETKVLISQINGIAEAQRLEMMNREEGVTADQQYALEQQKLEQQAREFEETLAKDREKLELERQKHEDNVRLKNKALQQQKTRK